MTCKGSQVRVLLSPFFIGRAEIPEMLTDVWSAGIFYVIGNFSSYHTKIYGGSNCVGKEAAAYATRRAGNLRLPGEFRKRNDLSFVRETCFFYFSLQLSLRRSCNGIRPFQALRARPDASSRPFQALRARPDASSRSVFVRSAQGMRRPG